MRSPESRAARCKITCPRLRNIDCRRRLVWGCLGAVAYIALATGCGPTLRKNLIFETTVALPSGRFVGPVEVEVPRQADHGGREFEIRAELVATCGPLLLISYPDGEISRIGDGNERWQSLLALRAQNNESSAEPPGESTNEANAELPSESTNEASAESPSEPTADSSAESPGEPTAEPPPPGTGADSAPAESGRWVRVTTESWPGQIEFLQTRESRCSARRRHATRYETGYDETGRVTVWAEVPQELGEAQLTVRVYEIIDVDAEAEARARVRERERERVRAERRRKEADEKAAEKEAARAREPRPPKPAPNPENPDPAEAEGATWSPGYWAYSPGEGKWLWVSGHWLAPARTPGPKEESNGSPPVAGCTWESGYWVWVEGPGRWDWTPGHWNAPPPRVEDRGQPPVPESPWVPGQWVADGASFKWIAGYWGRPTPRAETIPPPPFKGAQWRAGTWLKVSGKWVWSPGFYEDSRKAPPPRKQESPGTRPHPDAVWLAGFWRWSQKRTDYEWIAGHWELPPGEGYVWIPDPPDPQAGVSIGGRWELPINVDVNVDVDVDVDVKVPKRR
jgi:hypothetical protein